MGIPPNFQWIGSADPEVKSGSAVFHYPNDNAKFSVTLPDFATAFGLNNFIKAVYEGGRLEAFAEADLIMQNTFRNLRKTG